jgi:hypothetical protein
VSLIAGNAASPVLDRDAWSLALRIGLTGWFFGVSSKGLLRSYAPHARGPFAVSTSMVLLGDSAPQVRCPRWLARCQRPNVVPKRFQHFITHAPWDATVLVATVCACDAGKRTGYSDPRRNELPEVGARISGGAARL